MQRFSNAVAVGLIVWLESRRSSLSSYTAFAVSGISREVFDAGGDNHPRTTNIKLREFSRSLATVSMPVLCPTRPTGPPRMQTEQNVGDLSNSLRLKDISSFQGLVRISRVISILEGLLESRDELAAKDLAQAPNGLRVLDSRHLNNLT